MAAVGRSKPAGIVISAGKMIHTVKVQMNRRIWNSRIGKFYDTPYKLLVNDPTDAVREGDVIMLAPERHSKRVAHTVSRIIAPFGTPLDERPALLSQEERDAIREGKRQAHIERRRVRREEGKSPLSGHKRGVPDVPDKPWDKTIVDDGRIVLEGGKHKYGKINEEADFNKRRQMREHEKGMQNEKDREAVEAIPGEEVAKENLKIP